MSVAWLLLVACGSAPDRGPVERLVRASMALRGVHPSVREMERVERDPEAIDAIARGWLEDPRLGDTVRDLHAEQLLVRVDTRPHPTPIGALAAFAPDRIVHSLDEAPLRLVEQVVMGGRPYTEIVTTPTTMADEVVSVAYGVPWDPAGPEWQEAAWADGRPAAGLLSDTTLMQRYMSAEGNFHRSRGMVVLDTLLCTPIDPGVVAIVDPVTVEDAVLNDGTCSPCHAVLDPVAGAFWGFRRYVSRAEIEDAHDRDGTCRGDERDYACYPLGMWDEAQADDRPAALRPPALGDVPAPDVVALGQAIAADPRFASCTARRFAGYLGQVDPRDVPADEVSRLVDVLLGSGWDARELLLEIALSDWLATRPPLVIRPEQVDRAIEDLTGFAWTVRADASWADSARVGTTDDFGLRTLMGGVNGWDTLLPEHGPSPTRELAWEWVAAEAAAQAVDGGRLPAGGVVAGRDAVRDGIADLHFRVLGERASDATVDATFALWREARDRTDSPEHAWKLVITALLLDRRWVTY